MGDNSKDLYTEGDLSLMEHSSGGKVNQFWIVEPDKMQKIATLNFTSESELIEQQSNADRIIALWNAARKLNISTKAIEDGCFEKEWELIPYLIKGGLTFKDCVENA